MCINVEDKIKIILNEESEFDSIKNSIDKVYSEYYIITDIVKTQSNRNHGTILENGEALAAPTAAGCVFDYHRTTKFLRGVYATINNQLNSHENKKVKVLYAGTGPFASLLFPLLPILCEDDLEITLIDFHQDSVDAINKIIKHFGFEKFIKSIHKCDATKFIPPEGEKYDVLISETMRHALILEPQVAITLYLSQFLTDDGVLIPEKININAIITNSQAELSCSTSGWKNFWFRVLRANTINNRILLGNIMSLTKNSHTEYDFSRNPYFLCSHQVPKKLSNRKDVIYSTEIVVYEDIILTEKDNSGLTQNYLAKEIPPLNGGEKINFSYLLGREPKIVFEVE